MLWYNGRRSLSYACVRSGSTPGAAGMSTVKSEKARIGQRQCEATSLSNAIGRGRCVFSNDRFPE